MADYRPWHPVTVRPDNNTPKNDLEIRKADLVAIRAMWTGTANEDQQKRGMAAIIHMTGANDLPWLPDEHGGARETDFKCGKLHVGKQLIKLCTLPFNLLAENDDGGRGNHDRRSGKPGDDRNAARAKR